MPVLMMRVSELHQRANREKPGWRSGRPLSPRSVPLSPFGRLDGALRSIHCRWRPWTGRWRSGAKAPLTIGSPGWLPSGQFPLPASSLALDPPVWGCVVAVCCASIPNLVMLPHDCSRRSARSGFAASHLDCLHHASLQTGGSSASEAGLRRRQGKPSCPPWGASGDLPCAGAPVISPWVASQPAWGPVCCARSSGPWGQPHRNRLSHPWGGCLRLASPWGEAFRPSAPGALRIHSGRLRWPGELGNPAVC